MDPKLPKSFVDNFRESNPSYRPGFNEETDALFNPSIEAKPLHIPLAGQIRKRLNTEMEFYWALDRNGQNPFHTRVEQLRSVGFDFATTKDVDMAVADTVKGENEIRNGDLVLLKVPKLRWLEIRKSHLLQAIMMTNPRGRVMGEDGTVMGVQGLIPGIRTQSLETANIADVRASAGLRGSTIESNATADLAEGIVRGNASRVPLNKVNKGV